MCFTAVCAPNTYLLCYFALSPTSDIKKSFDGVEFKRETSFLKIHEDFRQNKTQGSKKAEREEKEDNDSGKRNKGKLC